MFWSFGATKRVLVSCTSYEGDVRLNETSEVLWNDHGWSNEPLPGIQRLGLRGSEEFGKNDSAYQVLWVGGSPL